MPTYHLRVNGKSSAVRFLGPGPASALRLTKRAGLRGAKFGCGLGQCGSCTVWIDGQAARSCITTVEQAAGHRSPPSKASARPRRSTECRPPSSPNRRRSADTAPTA